MKEYRIYPSIGVARLGNSTDEFFVGPEVPDLNFTPPPTGKYRAANEDIRRQGQRFRIYEFSYDNPAYKAPTRVREITSDDAEISWHVHLANRKSFWPETRNPEVNDPGVKTVDGANQSLNVVGSVFNTPVQLGTLKTDEYARLIVLGGFGKSASPLGLPLSGLFSAGWYDDVADGPVRATIHLRESGEVVPVEPAWVVTGVPKHASPVLNIVTLYDLAIQAATELPAGIAIEPPRMLSFTRDIYPMLIRPVFMQWVSAQARTGHGNGRSGDFMDPALFDLLKDNNPDPSSEARQTREHVFEMLKNPAGGGGTMPLLNGDLRVTPLQYEMFRQWAAGNFMADWTRPHSLPPPEPPAFDQIPPNRQPAALDQAAMSSCIGGSFFPGIEVGEIVKEATTYELPFRIKQTLVPGSLTGSLSVPWQADFTACGRGWWPGGRPDSVTSDGTNFYPWVPSTFSMDDMVAQWWKLGFLASLEVGGRTAYVETERLL